MLQDSTRSTTPIRDFRANFWSREFAHLNRRRCTWILAALAINFAVYVTGYGETTRTIAIGYVCWLLTVCVFEGIRRLVDQRATVIWWSTVAFLVDLGFVTLQMYNSGGGWWLGAAFYGIIVAIAALGLPRVQGLVVFATSLVAWTLLLVSLYLDATPPAPWFGLSAATGNVSMLVTQYLFGMLSLLALWVLLRTQTQRIRRAQESNRRMVESAPYAIFTMGADARIREANPAALALTAFSMSDVLGRGILRHVPAEQQPLAIDSFSRTLRGETVHFEHAFLCGDGVERWFSVSYSPIETASGERAVLAIARDLTTERKASIENERMQRELAESRRMQLVGRLVSGVAHELNNPLAAVMSFTEQLIAEAHDADTLEALGVVHAQADRARAIVRDLLQVVRDRGERMPIATDLGALLAGCVQSLVPAAEQAGVRLQLNVTARGHRAMVDAVGIAQVADNLLRNALLASPRGGVVQLQLTANDTGWLLTVTDQGHGIPDHVRAHLFEPFFTTRAPGEGTGLGLAVSQGIVEQHAGTITVDNVAPSEGTGACFRVHLPLILAEPDGAESHAESFELFTPHAFPDAMLSPEFMLTTRRLLLIDDEAAIRMALQRYLTRRGWEVTLCESGLHARELLLTADPTPPFDAVVCDLKMPGMTGIELYRVLESERPAYIKRLILATGDVASQDVATFLDTVQCPVLEKPFALASLSELLDQVAPVTDAAATT